MTKILHLKKKKKKIQLKGTILLLLLSSSSYYHHHYYHYYSKDIAVVTDSMWEHSDTAVIGSCMKFQGRYDGVHLFFTVQIIIH